MAKTIAYGAAADLGRGLRWMTRVKDYVAAYERRTGYEQALLAHGIVPDRIARELGRPIAKHVTKTTTPVSRPASQPPPLRIEPKARPRPAPDRSPKQVIPRYSVVADPRQSRPAAVKSCKGLRGSTATKWRR